MFPSLVRRIVACAVAVAACGALPVVAQTPAPPAGPTFAPYTPPPKDPNSYDDPGMHFQPSSDWQRVPVDGAPAGGLPAGGDPQIVAAYVRNRQKSDQRLLTISVQSFDGSLDGFERNHETDLRTAVDSTFVDKKTKTTLSNGMPAWLIKVSQGNDAGQYQRRIEYVVFDGQRGIVAAYAGRSGDFDDDEAAKALTSLYVVAYPRRRP